MQRADAGSRAGGDVGALRIERRMIELLMPFSLEVVVFEPLFADDNAREIGVASVSLDEPVVISDVVSFHAPDLPSTRHMIDARRLGLMRDVATLVDHDARVTALESGRLHAVLDVTEPERLPANSRCCTCPTPSSRPHRRI